MTDARAAGGRIPGGPEIGRLRKRGVQVIGRLEGPGSRRSSGLPPRTPFFLPSLEKMGPGSAQALKSYYVPTLLVLVSKYFLRSTNRLNFGFININ